MTSAEFVNIFYGVRYDQPNSRLCWDNDGERVYAVLDGGKAVSAFVSYETPNGVWTDWREVPAQFCESLTNGLAKAKELGIALEDLSRVILDSDLQTVILC